MRSNDSPLDPIAFESARQERETHVAGLFHPILSPDLVPDLQWVIPGFIPRGYLVLLAADPKEGKSCLATALALAVATGTPFAGMPTVQSAVLWLSMEEGPHERHLILKESPLADPATPLYTCYDHLPIDTEDGIDALDRWIDKTQAALIVVDPLHGAQSGRSLNDGWRARKTLKRLKKLCTERNITALVLHHAKHSFDHRPAKVAENAQLTATASMDIVLTHRDLPSLVFSPKLSSPSENEGGAGGGRSGPARLISFRCRGRGQFANRTVYFLSSGPLNYRVMDPEDEAFSLAEPETNGWVEAAVLKLLASKPKTSQSLIAEGGMTSGSLRNAITNLRRRGEVVVVNEGYPRRYALAEIEKNAA